MAHIFISYSHNDSDFVNALIEKLKEADFSAWIDAEQLRAGEDWRQSIDDGIRASFVLIAVMSPEAKSSEYVTYEWAYAWGAGVKVIPVLLHKTDLHPRLAALQYLDFMHPQQRPWEQLLKRLNDLKNSYVPLASKKSLDSGIEQLTNDLQNSDSNKRRNAAKALGNLKDESVVPDLTYVLSNDESWGARREAAYALGEIQSQEAITWLIRAIHSEQSVRVKQAITWALGEIASTDTTKKHGVLESTVSSLKQVGFEDRDPLVQRACVKALGKISRSYLGAKATKVLIDMLSAHFLDKSLLIEELHQNKQPEALAAVEEWRRKQQN